MAVAPTGILSLPIASLRIIISESTAFQTWVGAADATAARLSIFPAGMEVQGARPLCVINYADGGFSMPRIAGGSRGHFDPGASGRLQFHFEADVAPDMQDDPDFADGYFSFTNTVGAILSDIAELSGSDAYIDLRSVTLTYGPSRADQSIQEAEGDFYIAAFAVEWGSD